MDNKYNGYLSKGNGLKIFVITLTGKTIILRVIPDILIKDIKILIRLKAGIPVKQQRLIFAGKQLNDNKRFSNYNNNIDNEYDVLQYILMQ